jgi:hypothetical protein
MRFTLNSSLNRLKKQKEDFGFHLSGEVRDNGKLFLALHRSSYFEHEMV